MRAKPVRTKLEWPSPAITQRPERRILSDDDDKDSSAQKILASVVERSKFDVHQRYVFVRGARKVVHAAAAAATADANRREECARSRDSRRPHGGARKRRRRWHKRCDAASQREQGRAVA